ncbi:MerR family transcriptional regulator [Nocardia cyriacigeorgica]|jgi:DNA-binding transcriptional MerR regulator|uniref:MerR family transcriptional regulator n=1 Tax=Nocardia cyriacigeorgica TaxID=135487 RepID=UPI000CEA3F84|nr:MerR family transcriptional regulator [Nocardia cyriacigeorgica]AVH25657.1 MerR family transcriptional regulator [Nocardia cyriacigeorgica]MBF6088972.1 MerR family transcriptional regulator [Nocardia cyriacigeorgica]MBF6093546.1 MerR family transcriptional regulator [Nocardia cyriacigeorgica]MBF6318061.1 MerR family transcriptional regulator [Nocardia cyriacigeorgica]MBF6323457.1 MerR family transcriptional regulator [Nocardia cyriacigeorgica]
MLIGELSRKTGVNAHQLRYYEAQGLLEADRSPNGYRDYPENAVLRVRQIRHLLDAGLSSDDIAYLLPCATGEGPDLPGCPELLDAMRSRMDRLNDQLDKLTRSRNALADYIAAAEASGSEEYPPLHGSDRAPVTA